MASVNRVILVGHLGRDPETRFTQDGAAITNASIATSRRYKDAGGQQQEEAEWHRVCFFGRLAEIAGEYLKKGRSAYIEGRLRTRKWQDKDGHDRYTTEIVAESLQMLGGRGDYDAAGGSAHTETAVATAARKPAPSKKGPASAAPAAVAAMSDDIPF